MSLLNNQVKLIRSLQQKKHRQKHGLFVAEGTKTVTELVGSSYETIQIFTTDPSGFLISSDKITVITDRELQKISHLKTPNKVLGLFAIPAERSIKEEGLVVALDGVNDPGNLGTIIRLCDWFGVSQLICSKNTVDCYNQKVIQATMGSITRVQINYVNLTAYVSKTKRPVFSATINGNNVYQTNLPEEALLIMGSEAKGISPELEQMVTHQVTIPRFGKLQQAESLNVATATAILLSEFKRG